MNSKDINRLFSAKAAELLAQGYTIHAQTMGGSQGEYAHIDFSNGSEILRLLMDSDSDYDSFVPDQLVITVGKCPDPICDRGIGRTHGTVWNNRLEVRSQIRLSKVGKDWYVPTEEAQPISEKREVRYSNRDSRGYKELGDAYKSIALRWVRRQPKMKNTKLTDLGRMWKVTAYGKPSYEIEVKGRRLTIR